MKNIYILPRTVKPLKYNLTLMPDINKSVFDGEESVELEILENTKEITLNSRDLDIIHASVIQDKKINAENIDYDKNIQTVTFSFGDIIKKGHAILNLKFSGRLSSSMRGFYKSAYIDKKGDKKFIATTQFEPVDARSCFPCFDEPEIKSIFSVSMIINKGLDALSNMPIKSQVASKDEKKIIFEETPLMSTYLLAFIVGNFDYLEGKTKDNTKVRIITTPGKKDYSRFALDVAIKTIEYYNDYFNFKYPLPKLDLIAIPDFESGAMENWGLITYRETALLIDEKNSSAATKQRVALVISHEIAHQWFGNLVTMKWWNDLWLNEGFASWIEYKPIDHIFPEWDLWTQFLCMDTISAFSLDGLKTTHEIEVDVKNPNEIGEIFDAISYSKGASIIRMLENYLGEDKFRDGLRNYINNFKYSNARTDDLWLSLEMVSGEKIRQMMNTWTKQPGYPIIKVSSKNNEIIIEQEKFSYIKDNKKLLWNIPFSVSYKNKTLHEILDKPSISLNYDIDYLNKSQVGFYRVSYDEKMFSKIKIMLKNLKTIDRLGMENNMFALARGNKIKLNEYLDFLEYYKDEDDYSVWEDISINLFQISLMFPKNKEIEKFTRELFFNIMNKIGWDEKKMEDHKTKMLRSVVLMKLGFNNEEKILKEAGKRFDDYLIKKELNPNIRLVVYSLASYQGDKKTYENLKSLYLNSNFQEEKSRILSALGKFRNSEILNDFLDFIMSKDVKNQDILTAVSSIANNPFGLDMVWIFFRQNYENLENRFGKTSHAMSNLTKIICSKFSSDEKIDEVKKFFEKKDITHIKRALSQSLEIIEINRNFIDENNALLIK